MIAIEVLEEKHTACHVNTAISDVTPFLHRGWPIGSSGRFSTKTDPGTASMARSYARGGGIFSRFPPVDAIPTRPPIEVRLNCSIGLYDCNRLILSWIRSALRKIALAVV